MPAPERAADRLHASLRADPVIASVQDAEGLEDALAGDHEVVFLLYGSLLDISQTLQRCHDAGKIVLVNLDFLDGLSAQDTAVRWLAESTVADGVLSSKPSVIRAARTIGLAAVQRYFLVDSLSYRRLPRVLSQGEPDLVEILPGCVPRVISWLQDDISTPVIAGGLVCEKGDVIAALDAGALAVATSDRNIWAM